MTDWANDPANVEAYRRHQRERNMNGPYTNRGGGAAGDQNAGGADAYGYQNLPDTEDEELEDAEDLPGVGPDATPEEIAVYAREHYGYLAAFLNHSEVGPILMEASRYGWEPELLKGALHKTNWWQNTSDSQRMWQQLVAEDPAAARRRVAQIAADIRNTSASMGLGMSAGDIAGLATTSASNGWTSAQEIDALIARVNWNTLQGGDLTAYRDNAKAIGADYLVTVSEQTARNYAERIASGELSEDGVRSIMQSQAKARFGHLASVIDQGITVKDYFSPLRDAVAQELGMASENIDLMDNKWLRLMEEKDDKGNIRAATLDEVMMKARKTDEYAQSQNATELITNMSSAVSNLFGRRAY